jgi:methylglutaconyl-CoA hydratase
MSDMFAAIDRCAKPVIGQVHGAALGGGMGLLAVCDVVVAADDAVFGFTETKLGIIPAVISRFVVPKIGESWARALFLTGERFGTTLARDIGLVHWIAEEPELERVTREKIDELLSAGPRAVEEAKSLVQNLRGQDDAGRRTLTVQQIAALRTSPEGQEGLSSFLDRRTPSWRQ